jgi:hypothetical protein
MRERRSLDVKTDLLTCLIGGKQGWKCPVVLLMTCCGSKSLKVILIYSDFRVYPVLNPLDPVLKEGFFQRENLLFPSSL